jgi:hypothetical protein
MARQHDWTNRRQVIFRTLRLCAALVVMIVCTACGAVIFGVYTGKAVPVDASLTAMLSNALWPLCGLSGSIIGSYVFGAAWENRGADHSEAGK